MSLSEFSASISEGDIKEMKLRQEGDGAAHKKAMLFPIAVGHVVLNAGGGTQTVTDTNINADDIAIVTLTKDSGTTSITNIIAVCTANTLTLTFTDDGSSTDDGEANFVIFRPYN